MLKGVIENNYYELYRIQFCLSLNSLRKSYNEYLWAEINFHTALNFAFNNKPIDSSN